MILDEYILNLPKIGEGSYGEVYLTSKKNSKEIYATKKVEKQKIMSEKLRQYFLNEIEILKNLNHTNIMQLVEIKTSHNNIYLITEYCNGGTLSENLSMYQKLHKKPFTEKIVIYLMKQIADAIHYLHEKNIIHRDLKMENILLHFENLDDRKKLNLHKAKVKIIDFGFARYLNNNSISSSIVGSPLNMAPDILHALTDPNWRKNLKYNEKADIYSIGVIMFILLIGKPPFNAGDYKDLFSKVNYGIYSIPKDLRLSNECITLMNGMMMQDSEKRFSIMEVLRSDFLMKPYEKFEIVDFADFESNAEKNKNKKNSNNYVLQQNENNFFLDIKQMINLDNKKLPQQQLNENINDNKENMNVILNDMNNKDEELEVLLEQLKTNNIHNNNNERDENKKIESNMNLNNYNNYNSNNNEKNFLAQHADSLYVKKPAAKNSNLIENKGNIGADHKDKEKDKANEIKFAKDEDSNKQLKKEVKEQEKDNFVYPDLDGNAKKTGKVIGDDYANPNHNLINLDSYENIKGYFTEVKSNNVNVISNKKNSDKNLAYLNKEDELHKGIFDIPIEKLDSIFDMINKKFEMFEMEAIPIYLENPQHYENFIL